MRYSLLSAFRALATNKRIAYSILDTGWKPLDLVREVLGWDILHRIAKAAKALQKPSRALRAQRGTVERRLRLASDTGSNAL
jgi:hypothetical protein